MITPYLVNAQNDVVSFPPSESWLSDTLINELKERDDFIYVVPKKFEAGTGFKEKWDAFIRSLLKKINAMGRSEIFQVVIMVGALFLLLYFIATSGFVRKKKVDDKSGVSEWDQLYNQSKSDDTFMITLGKYEDESQYREAIRWLFLRYLSQLEKLGMIVWQSGKTNWDYGVELKEQSVYSVFIQMMHGYNEAWFGHHLADESSYANYKSAAFRAIQELKPKST